MVLRLGPTLALALAAACMGSGVVLAKIAMIHGGVGPWGVAFWRFAIAGPPLSLAWLAAKRRRAGAPDARERTLDRGTLLMLLPGPLLAAEVGAWYVAMVYTSAAASTVIVNTAVLLVGVAAWALYGQRPHAIFWGGAIVAIAGVAALVIAEPGPVSTSSSRVLGDLIAMASACAYASYLLTVARLRARVQSLEIATATTWTAALVLVAAPHVAGERYLADSVAGWAAMAGNALVGQVCGHLLLAWAMARVAPATSALVLLVLPVATVTLAWIALDDAVDLPQLASMALIVAGIYVAKRGTPEESPHGAAAGAMHA